jgi:hypothetical protein
MAALMPTKAMATVVVQVSVVDETSVEVEDVVVDVVQAEDVVLEKPKVIPLQTNWLTNLMRVMK